MVKSLPVANCGLFFLDIAKSQYKQYLVNITNDNKTIIKKYSESSR